MRKQTVKAILSYFYLIGNLFLKLLSVSEMYGVEQIRTVVFSRSLSSIHYNSPATFWTFYLTKCVNRRMVLGGTGISSHPMNYWVLSRRVAAFANWLFGELKQQVRRIRLAKMLKYIFCQICKKNWSHLDKTQLQPYPVSPNPIYPPFSIHSLMTSTQ